MQVGRGKIGWKPHGLPLYECKSVGDGYEVCTTSKYYYPLANIERFRMPKPEGVVRIFCVGGSTTHGAPFYTKGSFVYLLGMMLHATDSFGHYQVINAGVSAAASSDIKGITREILGYDPDYLIIYMGNNEFFDRDSEKVRGWPGRVRFSLKSLSNRLMTYRLIKGITIYFFGSPGSVERISGKEMIEEKVRSFRGRALSNNWDDVARRDVMRQYRDNLLDILRMCRAQGVEVVLSTVAVNLRDYPPLEPGPSLPIVDGCWDEAAGRIRDSGLWGIDKTKKACREFSDMKPDSANATEAYQRGCCALMEGYPKKAGQYFFEAVEKDPLPIRATPEINSIIRELAHSEGITLADVESVFFKPSANTVPGDEFFVDQVHLTLQGQVFTAMAIVEALAKMGAVNPGHEWLQRMEAATLSYRSGLSRKFLYKAYFHAASMNTISGRFYRARRLCEQALEEAPGDLEALALLADLDEVIKARGFVGRDSR